MGEKWEAEIAEARSLGRNHGFAAASWVFDGNTSQETYEAFRKGLEDGDPEILDQLPSAPLSGEWADGPTPASLYEELGIDEAILDGMLADPFCDAYEEGFDEAVMESVESAIAAQLDEATS